MSALRILILALFVALGTILIGWWAVPVVALAYGVLARARKRPGAVAALAAALGWGGYLAVMSFGGAPVGALATRLSVSMQLPAWGVLALTLAFPAFLAGTASYLGARLGARYLTPP
jgi:hypothetical protein